MISFCISLVVLIAGFLIYGKFVEKVFGIEPNRKTPAVANPDGVDFVPLPAWKIFMIQFLNIAGLGPIFGAIMGAKFGTSAFLWIVFGTIFAGAVHDYLAGMISLRHNGESLPETIGRYLGITAKQVMRAFTMILMILVGVVFVAGPSDLLAMLTPETFDARFWIFVIFAYYILATLFPIDKIIGRVYPLFAIALIFMAIGILIMLFVTCPDIPELTGGLGNKSASPENNPLFPMLFISIACGAISGFHATQSPLMARCMTNERQGRYIFYGSMVTEGVVALIWAAAATYFFSPEGQAFFGVTEPEKVNGNSAVIVNLLSTGWLGVVGGALAILGVVAAPITSGDTAFRSARLIVADFLHLEQRSVVKRLMICIPMFIVAILILIYSLSDPAGFEKIWRYFAWSNQTLATFTLWAITVYLAQKKKPYWITLIPALFMMSVVLTYILFDRSGIALSYTVSVTTAVVVTLLSAVWFFLRLPKMQDVDKI